MHANRVSAASDRCFFTIEFFMIEFFMIELVKANRVSANLIDFFLVVVVTLRTSARVADQGTWRSLAQMESGSVKSKRKNCSRV